MPKRTAWRTAPLSESIASLDAGVSVNAEDRPHGAGEIGVLKTSALNGGVFHPRQNKAVLLSERARVAEPVLADSILLSRMNTPALVGESCYVADNWPTLFVPDRIWQLKPKDRDSISMRWLAYVLRSSAARAYIEVHATGTSGSMKNLPKSKLLDLTIVYPPVGEQRVIAQVLDTLDTTIRQTEAIIEKLKQVKQGLLHDLLTRGIDANGELRPPQSQAPHLYKDSPLGGIPREWETITLGAAVRRSGGLIQTGPFGSQLHAHEYIAEGVPLIMPQDILDGAIDRAQIAMVSDRKATTMARHQVAPNDVVFARRGDLSRCATIGEREFGWLCGTGCLLVRLPKTDLLGVWLSLVYRQPVVQAQVLGRAVGSTMANLNTGILSDLLVTRPPVSEQSEIDDRIRALSSRQEAERDLASKLSLEKSGLMDDLLTGRVRVTPLLA